MDDWLCGGVAAWRRWSSAADDPKADLIEHDHDPYKKAVHQWARDSESLVRPRRLDGRLGRHVRFLFDGGALGPWMIRCADGHQRPP